MPLYTPNEFKWRDLLPEGDEDKIVKGQHFDTEFDAIASALGQLESTVDPNGDGLNPLVEEAPLDGEVYARQNGGWTDIQEFDDTEVKGLLADETAARIAGDAALAEDIATGDQGLQDQLDALTAAPGYDDTQIKADLDTEVQARIAGDNALQGQIDDIETSIDNINSSGYDDSALWDAVNTHDHAGVYEPAFSKNTGFNKNFGVTADTVAQGDHTHAWGSITGKPAVDNYSKWILKVNTAGAQNVTTGATVDFKAGANMTITQSGTTLTFAASGGGASGNFVSLDATANQTMKGTLTAPDFIATSDERLKADITPMPIGLIDDIKPVSWTWKDGGTRSAGVVAQQLQEIGLDDYVHEGEDGQLGVNYQALTAILLAEVIELKRRLADS